MAKPPKPHVSILLAPRKKTTFVCKLCGQSNDCSAEVIWAGWTGWICSDADECRKRELGEQDPRLWSPWSI